jgi:periplasmic protein TonB
MPRAMFHDVVEPSVTVGSRTGYTVPVSILVHVLLLAAVVAAPLIATDVLPAPQTIMAFAAPRAAPPPPPPPAAPPTAPRPAAPLDVSPNAAPLLAPDGIRAEAPRTAVHLSQGVPGGVEGGISEGQLGGLAVAIPVAPPRVSTPPAPLHVGGDIKAPRKVRHATPVYPLIAQRARVQGLVIIDATIGPDGRVSETRIRQGNPLLDQAALDAVRQWQFTPTLLNGVPVPVIMTVTVNFTLD